jgi:hypothetical protein
MEILAKGRAPIARMLMIVTVAISSTSVSPLELRNAECGMRSAECGVRIRLWLSRVRVQGSRKLQPVT